MKHAHHSRWPVPLDDWPVSPASLAAQYPSLDPQLFEGLFSEEFTERDAAQAVRVMKAFLDEARMGQYLGNPGHVYYCTDSVTSALNLLSRWIQAFHAATRTGLTVGEDDDAAFELQIRFLKTLLSALSLTDEGETHDA